MATKWDKKVKLIFVASIYIKVSIGTHAHGQQFNEKTSWSILNQSSEDLINKKSLLESVLYSTSLFLRFTNNRQINWFFKFKPLQSTRLNELNPVATRKFPKTKKIIFVRYTGDITNIRFDLASCHSDRAFNVW